jgi:predicted MFS family arabinose efflux permease
MATRPQTAGWMFAKGAEPRPSVALRRVTTPGLATAAVGASFIVLTGTWPGVHDRAGAPIGVLGALLAWYTVIRLGAMFLSRRVATARQGAIIRALLVALALGSSLWVMARDPVSLVLAAALLGFAAGGIDVAATAMALAEPGRWRKLLAAGTAFCLGSLLAAGILAASVASGAALSVVGWATAIVALAAALWAPPGAGPYRARRLTAPAPGEPDLLRAYVIAAALLIGAESALASWMPTLLSDQDAGSGGYVALAVFWLGLGAGRLIAWQWPSAARRASVLVAIAAVLAPVALLAGPSAAIVAFAICGALLGPTLAVLTHDAAGADPARRTRRSSSVLIGASIGAAVLPALIGPLVADDLAIAAALVAGALLIGSGALARLAPTTERGDV